MESAPGNDAVIQQDIRRSRLDLKNLIPLDLYEGMEYAAYIRSALLLPNGKVQPRHLKAFYRIFWKVFNYVRSKLDADMCSHIDNWFRHMNKNFRNTQLILVGVNLFLQLNQELNDNWGLGVIFEKGLEPAFMIEDLDGLEMEVERELDIQAGIK